MIFPKESATIEDKVAPIEQASYKLLFSIQYFLPQSQRSCSLECFWESLITETSCDKKNPFQINSQWQYFAQKRFSNN